MSDESPSPASWPPWIEEWVLPYLENRALWPVWVALIGHVIVGIAGLMLLGSRTGLPEAWIALVAIGVGSGWLVNLEWRATGSLGGVSLTVALAWGISFGLAGFADATGMF